VREYEDHVVFMHEIVKGGTDRSYGIHVARLAGIPAPVIVRARTILQHLEESRQERAVETLIEASAAPELAQPAAATAPPAPEPPPHTPHLRPPSEEPAPPDAQLTLF